MQHQGYAVPEVHAATPAMLHTLFNLLYFHASPLMRWIQRSVTLPKLGSFTLPPASPRPATGLLYDQPANCCCIVCDSRGPSTYESLGASEVNSRSKLAVSRASICRIRQSLISAYSGLLLTTLGLKLGSYFRCKSFLQSILAKK